ncbi:MAG: YbaN family protein [Pseudomonadota bacterium]
MRVFWIALGCLAVGLGAVGTVLPLLPTVPFMLLAAFCFARSSPRLHAWLTEHPTFGGPIADWRAHGAIRRPVKRLALATIAAAFGVSLIVGASTTVLVTQAVVLSAVIVFIFTRPDGPE